MTTLDDAIALAAFAVGFAAGAATWWLLRRSPEEGYAGPTGPPGPSVDPSDARGSVTALPPDPIAVPAASGRGVLRTSQRVVLHLATHPRLNYGEVAPFELTQAGMSRSLGVAQPALARVLGRLIAGDAILEMRTHVSGSSRRLKVYQLTVHGEAIARDLRRQKAAGPRLGPVAPRAVVPTPSGSPAEARTAET